MEQKVKDTLISCIAQMLDGFVMSENDIDYIFGHAKALLKAFRKERHKNDTDNDG